ncbi:H-type lectin domain containing protein [Klebsormidium nitens]|uniref:H-type lectin domain containing protein n=1 Tax=Klebsormidium nitens TaxID=105231 RepID=A0A1Y1IID5_KLENI|nr:H-type lectin domain containing protein [Klebsormidium nitens]|eukprot:GAQ90463.1 H-type lectin domain containing protein [Klebsormidium nitens]
MGHPAGRLCVPGGHPRGLGIGCPAPVAAGTLGGANWVSQAARGPPQAHRPFHTSTTVLFRFFLFPSFSKQVLPAQGTSSCFGRLKVNMSLQASQAANGVQQVASIALQQTPPVNYGLHLEEGTVGAGFMGVYPPSTPEKYRFFQDNVTFKTPFTKPPIVHIALSNLELTVFRVEEGLSVYVFPENVTTTGFTATFRALETTSAYGTQARWLAIGSSN